MKELEKKLQAQMDKTIEALKYEFSTIRAGRANAQMLDKIRVDYYVRKKMMRTVNSSDSDLVIQKDCIVRFTIFSFIAIIPWLE